MNQLMENYWNLILLPLSAESFFVSMGSWYTDPNTFMLIFSALFLLFRSISLLLYNIYRPKMIAIFAWLLPAYWKRSISVLLHPHKSSVLFVSLVFSWRKPKNVLLALLSCHAMDFLISVTSLDFWHLRRQIVIFSEVKCY